MRQCRTGPITILSDSYGITFRNQRKSQQEILQENETRKHDAVQK